MPFDNNTTNNDFIVYFNSADSVPISSLIASLLPYNECHAPIFSCPTLPPPDDRWYIAPVSTTADLKILIGKWSLMDGQCTGGPFNLIMKQGGWVFDQGLTTTKDVEPHNNITLTLLGSLPIPGGQNPDLTFGHLIYDDTVSNDPVPVDPTTESVQDFYYFYHSTVTTSWFKKILNNPPHTLDIPTPPDFTLEYLWRTMWVQHCEIKDCVCPCPKKNCRKTNYRPSYSCKRY